MRFKHGLSEARIYHCWENMLQRCYNPKNDKYHRYGGRGIRVCAKWHRFINFFEDNIEDYKPYLSLDRINNDGHYEPNNCRWATPKEQGKNRDNKEYMPSVNQAMLPI